MQTRPDRGSHDQHDGGGGRPPGQIEDDGHHPHGQTEDDGRYQCEGYDGQVLPSGTLKGWHLLSLWAAGVAEQGSKGLDVRNVFSFSPTGNEL